MQNAIVLTLTRMAQRWNGFNVFVAIDGLHETCTCNPDICDNCLKEYDETNTVFFLKCLISITVMFDNI